MRASSRSARYPELNVDVDRSRIGQLWADRARRDRPASPASLAGTQQTAPVYYLNPENGVSYLVVAQTPEYKVGSISDLANIPVTGTNAGANAQVLGGSAPSDRIAVPTPAVVSHYNIQPAIDIYATPNGRDLGAVAGDIKRVIRSTSKALSSRRATTVTLRGQYQTMNSAFSGLFFGLIGAIVLIYLLIVVNFQSWLDPFVIITALPGAIAGIVWMLFLTGTTLSVPGPDRRDHVHGRCHGQLDPRRQLRARAAGGAGRFDTGRRLEAGMVRFRPVLMTALAMIIGMVPMALGLGEGGEQNAPLGRAVIGGLIVATFATLMFVPVIFSLVHRKDAERAAAKARRDEILEEAHV